MHLWHATFQVGDFGRKQLTVTTQQRASSGPDEVLDEADRPQGGFAEAEWRALEQARQETSGWPNPIELVAIEYLDEIAAPELPKAKPRPKK